MSRPRTPSSTPPAAQLAPPPFVGRTRALDELRGHLASTPLLVLYGAVGAGKSAVVERLAAALAVATTVVRCRAGDRAGAVRARAERRLRCPPGGLGAALAAEVHLLVIDDLHRLDPDEAARVVTALCPTSGALGRVVAIAREPVMLPAEVDRDEIELGGLDAEAAAALWQHMIERHGPAGELVPALMRTRGLPLFLRREYALARFGAEAWTVRGLDGAARRTLELLAVLRVPVAPAALAQLEPGLTLGAALSTLAERQLLDVDGAGRLLLHDLVQDQVLATMTATARAETEHAAALLVAPDAIEEGALLALDRVDRLRECVHHHLAAGDRPAAIEVLRRHADVIARRGAGGEIEALIAAIGADHAPDLGAMQIELAVRAGRVAEARERIADGVAAAPVTIAALALAAGDLDQASARLAAIEPGQPGAARAAALAAELDLVRGEPALARDRIDRALRSAGASERVELLLVAATLDEHAGDPGAARAALTRASGALAAGGLIDDELGALIDARRAAILAAEGRLAEAKVALDEARTRAHGLDAMAVTEQVEHSQAVIELVRGDCEGAVRRLAAIIASRRGRGDELGALTAELFLAEVALRRGDLTSAAELAGAARTTATRLRLPGLADRALLALATVELGEMRLDRARDALDKVAASTGLSALAQARCAQLQAEVRAAGGQRAGAVDAARAAGAAHLGELERDLAEARVATAAGDIGRALGAARRVAAAAVRAGRGAELAEALVIGCRLELAKGDRGGARAQASRAAREAAAAGLLRPRAHALLALASLARDDGDTGAAATYARDASELAQLAGLPVERLAATVALDAITGGDVEISLETSGAAAAMTPAAIDAASRLLSDLGLTALRPFRIIDAAGAVSEVADADPEVLRLPVRTLAVDAVRETIWRRGTELADLRRRSLLKKLLFLFAAAPGKTFSKEEIVQTVWSVAYHPLRHDAALFTNIMRIRRLLGEDGAEIIRVTEDGYRFDPPEDFIFVTPA